MNNQEACFSDKLTDYHKQKGMGLIEVMAALMISSSIFVMYANMSTDAQKQTRDTVSAQQLKLVMDAATRYVQDNSTVIQASATATVPAVITPAMLSATNYLPASFINLNPYHQATTIEVLQPVAGGLQATVITTGGDTISDSHAPRIASKVGMAGGYTPSATPTVAQGSSGGWSMPLTYNTNPGAGHLVGALYFNNGQLISDYLHRHSVAGHPEANQMFTDLDMNGNNIDNANEVTTRILNSENQFNSGNISTSNVQINGVSVKGGGCSPNGLISQDGTGAILNCVAGVWKRPGGIDFDGMIYKYVGDGGLCPSDYVMVGAGGWYMTYTAGYLYCVPVM